MLSCAAFAIRAACLRRAADRLCRARRRPPPVRKRRPRASDGEPPHARTRAAARRRSFEALLRGLLRAEPAARDVHRRPPLQRPAAEQHRPGAARAARATEPALPGRGRARSIATRLAGADRISYDIFLRERERARRSRERFPGLPAADQPGRRPAHDDADARFGHQRAAVRDRQGLRASGCAGSTASSSGSTRRSSTCAKASRRGVVQPRAVMEKVLPQLDAMIVARCRRQRCTSRRSSNFRTRSPRPIATG